MSTFVRAGHVHAHVYAHVSHYAHVYTHVRQPLLQIANVRAVHGNIRDGVMARLSLLRRVVFLCVDMRMIMFMDMCMDTSAGTCTDMCMKICLGMRTEIYMNMFRHVHVHITGV